jgi:hypothetical protein
MIERVDAHRTRDVGDRLGAGEPITAVDVHGAGAANAFATGAAEGERRVDLVFDLYQGVQHHRATRVEIDGKRIHARPRATIRIVAVDMEFLDALRFGRRRPSFAPLHSRIRREA